KAISKDRLRERVDSYSKSIKTTSSRNSGVNLSGKASLSDGLSGELGANHSADSAREEFVEMVIKTSHFIDFAEIRDGLTELTSAIEVDHVAFLIDEWSQIDTKLQPIFAELIRRTIGTCNNVTCKVA